MNDRQIKYTGGANWVCDNPSTGGGSSSSELSRGNGRSSSGSSSTNSTRNSSSVSAEASTDSDIVDVGGSMGTLPTFCGIRVRDASRLRMCAQSVHVVSSIANGSWHA